MGWLLVLLIFGLVDFTSQFSLTNTTCDSLVEFDCGTGPLGCLPITWKCDNVKDCYNGADEIGCPPNECKAGELHCSESSYNKCVDGRYKCDGIEDCSSWSDEWQWQCEYNSRRAGILPPFNYGDPDLYKHDGGYDKDGCLPGFGLCSYDYACIPNEKFCDGVNDCGWEEDERNCTTREPIEEIDHCTLKKRACHHFCENMNNGSFVCSCAKGYELEEDGKTCRRSPSEGILLLSRDNTITKKQLEDYSETEFTDFREVEKVITAFDYFRRDDKLFMSICKDPCELVKLVVEENGKQTILHENHPIMRLYVDWIGGNLFFIESVLGADRVLSSTISVCTMDLKFCRRFDEIEVKRFIQDFAIHPIRGRFFWVEGRWTEDDRSAIMMANMDGSQVQTLVENKIVLESTLAIDYENNYLYFQKDSDSDNFVRRVNIDTKQIEIIPQNLRFSSDAMVHHNGFLYMSSGPNSLRILDVKRKNARIHNILPQGSPDVFDLRVNDSLHQVEPSHNPCKDIDCPWICVIVPGFTAKCLCPNGYTSSIFGTTCIPPSEENEKPDNQTHIRFELMSEYCKNGVGCLNGGVCREVLNRTRIVCDCQEPYDGLYCERRKPMVSGETILLIAALLLLIATVYGIYCLVFYKRNKKIGSKATDLFTKLTSSETQFN